MQNTCDVTTDQHHEYAALNNQQNPTWAERLISNPVWQCNPCDVKRDLSPYFPPGYKKKYSEFRVKKIRNKGDQFGIIYKKKWNTIKCSKRGQGKKITVFAFSGIEVHCYMIKLCTTVYCIHWTFCSSDLPPPQLYNAVLWLPGPYDSLTLVCPTMWFLDTKPCDFSWIQGKHKCP